MFLGLRKMIMSSLDVAEYFVYAATNFWFYGIVSLVASLSKGGDEALEMQREVNDYRVKWKEIDAIGQSIFA